MYIELRNISSRKLGEKKPSNSKSYHPARLDLHESGIIEKPFKRTSTAICFQFFILDLEFLKQLQSSEPLHAKRPLILLLVRFTVSMCSSRDLLRQTVFHKCGRGINCSLDCSSQVKKFHHSATRTKIELHCGGFFHQMKVRQPIGRQHSMQTVNRTSRRLGSILREAPQNFEVVSNIQY